MNQAEVEDFVAKLDNVQREVNFGYTFFFVGDDHRLPFVTIAGSDNDYDRVSNLNREGVFRINIGISNRPPSEYMAEIEQQIATQQLTLGEITDAADLARNLEENAVPASLAEVSATGYPQFLAQRRQLMAAAIRRYYEKL